MKKTGVAIPGFKLAKDGKTPIRDEKRLDVSKRITQRKSTRVTVKKRIEQDFRP